MTVAHIGLLEPSCGAFPSMNKPCFARERATKGHSASSLGRVKYESYRLFCSKTIRTRVNGTAPERLFTHPQEAYSAPTPYATIFRLSRISNKGQNYNLSHE